MRIRLFYRKMCLKHTVMVVDEVLKTIANMISRVVPRRSQPANTIPVASILHVLAIWNGLRTTSRTKRAIQALWKALREEFLPYAIPYFTGCHRSRGEAYPSR